MSRAYSTTGLVAILRLLASIFLAPIFQPGAEAKLTSALTSLDEFSTV
jgi:hypothetical protein